MKIEKVEDLRKCHWRKLTEHEWAEVPIHSKKCILKKNKFYNKDDIDCFFQNHYYKIAREIGLPRKEVKEFLRTENYAFHQKLGHVGGWDGVISEEDFALLKQLLEIPVIITEVGKIKEILEQVNELSSAEKVVFVGEIWNNYLYPELERQQVEEVHQFFK